MTWQQARQLSVRTRTTSWMMAADQTTFSGERPLSKGALFALSCAAGGTILLFYLFAAITVMLLLVVLAGELVFVVAAARFGLAAPMARMLTRHMAPLPIFFRSFWIKKGSEFHVDLQTEDAPGLFKMLTALCERAKVAQPRIVLLEMSANAWVRLSGYRRGAGKTTLGLGYDLLAGLAENEIEAVLGHELTHAKLVQRGLNQWLRRGLNRAARLAAGLAGLVEAGRQTRQSARLAQTLLRPADWLARTCARLVAGCSRQDEFAADHGAAMLCGAHALRSALIKLDPIAKKASHLPWRERVAQLQLGESFSDWLVSELAPGNPSENGHGAEAKTEAFNKYSTHPSLSDRLAALPVDTAANATGCSEPAIKLLSDPDRIAEQLIAEILRVNALQELKDSKALNRWSRKVGSRSALRPLQSLGLLVALIGFIGGLVYWLSVEMSAGVLEFMLATVVPGIVCYRLGGYREHLALPLPDLAQLKTAFQGKVETNETKIKQIETAFREQSAAERGARRQARLLVQEAYAALGKCDYLRAHVAARLSLQLNKNAVEAMIALAVAAAAFGQGQQVTRVIQAIQRRIRITRGSAAWGIGWALLLLANWGQAEAFLQLARKGRTEDHTLLALVAICQARRGKLQSAILSARQAWQGKPRDREIFKLLISLLLDSGFLREAQQRLDTLKAESSTDPELMFSMVRLHLMMRNSDGAEQWAERLKTTSAGARTLLQLGGAYESSRRAEQAASLYTQALATGHYPEALLGLGRLEAGKQNKETARGHLLAALDLERPAAADSCGPLAIFQLALQQLLMLQEPAANCTAWIATLNGGGAPQALADKSLIVFSPTRDEAEQSLGGLLRAMRPGRPPLLPGAIGWQQAPQEQQPFGLARPGVQGVLG